MRLLRAALSVSIALALVACSSGEPDSPDRDLVGETGSDLSEYEFVRTLMGAPADAAGGQAGAAVEPAADEEEPSGEGSSGEPDPKPTSSTPECDKPPRTSYLWDPEIASNGSSYVAVWVDRRSVGVVGARISADGALVDPENFVVSAGGEVEIAWNEDANVYLIAWTTGSYGQVDAVRLDEDGRRVDPAPLTIAPPDASDTRGVSSHIAIAASGDGFALAHVLGKNDQMKVSITQVAASGQSGMPVVADECFECGPASVVSAPYGVLLAWRDSWMEPAYHTAPFDAETQTLGDVNTMDGEWGHGGEVVARNGDGFVIAWDDSEAPAPALLRAHKMDEHGKRIGDAMTVATYEGGPVGTRPVLSATATSDEHGNTMLQWTVGRHDGWGVHHSDLPSLVETARIPASGSVASPATITTSYGLRDGGIAWGDGHPYSIWFDHGMLLGAPLTASGERDEDPVVISERGAEPPDPCG